MCVCDWMQCCAELVPITLVLLLQIAHLVPVALVLFPQIGQPLGLALCHARLNSHELRRLASLVLAP